MDMSYRIALRHIGLLSQVGMGLMLLPAHAWVLNITPGTRAVYLAVGNATTNAANATVNQVGTTLLLANVTSGIPQPLLTSNSTQAASPYDGYTVCTPGAGQIYVGGFFRMPGASASTAVLQVTTPAGLTSGVNSIPFSQISWASTSIGNNSIADIPAGTFVNGGTLFLRSFAANNYVENCHAFTYANTNIVPAGIYQGQASYTLTAP